MYVILISTMNLIQKPKLGEIRAGRRKLHDEKLRNFEPFTKYLGDQIKENEMGKTCRKHGKMGNAYRIPVGIPEETICETWT
jgi:hypothetical protein